MVSSAALGFLLARAERLREAVVAIAAWNLNHGKLQNTSLQKVQKWLKRVCSVWNSEMLALGKECEIGFKPFVAIYSASVSEVEEAGWLRKNWSFMSNCYDSDE